MKIVTFNIRCDYNQDGANNFENRKDMIKGKLKEENPDIVCFQEVLPHVAHWLKMNLENYYVIGCGRERDLNGEQNSVAFKKEKFQLISMNTFWLSLNPEIPGTRYEKQSMCPRSVTELFLKDLETENLYYLLNTHLDHESSEARVLGMDQIIKHIKNTLEQKEQSAYGKINTILAGDFNEYPDSAEIQLIEKSGFLRDITFGMEGTFHDYGRADPSEKIDYIAVSMGLQCSKRELWKECIKGVYLSDHYPVSVVLEAH
ncbi:endonuclease/exonuclease/phosphatase family metal-dependent hydrolase [Anaerotaenia torta]|uniref:endonuclease/exonuclease/phosphatase family protein n=1 Tax=Anaerotaenia torta TaxID=433293 RepID=UPI003D1BBF1A